MGTIYHKIEEYLSRYMGAFYRILRQEHIFMVGVASLLGFFVGVAAVWFEHLIDYVHDFFYSKVGTAYQTGDAFTPELLLIPLIVAFGGLAVGIMNHFFNKRGESASVSEVMRWAAVDRRVPGRTIWFRPIASALTIGTGGSGGKEGPIVQIGACIGSWIGTIIKASSERIRLLIGCGSAAAIAAAFNAPLGGLIFAIEVIMADFNIKIFSPLIFSSVIATVTKRSLTGDMPVFDLPNYSLISTWEIIFFTILGIICGLLATLFYKVYFRITNSMKKLGIHPILLPAVGGLLVGIIGIPFPDVLGNGYSSMDKVLTGEMALWLAVSLIFLKVIATPLSLGTHGSGGLFAPALFVGSMAGGAIGMLLNHLFPEITGPSGAYALVGMGAVMSAIAHAPLSNILMVFELTNNYYIILPIMVACISSTFVYSYFIPNSIYMEKLRLVGINIWQGRESLVMDTILIKDVMTDDYTTIPEDMKFKDILSLIQRSKDLYFITLEPNGNMSGILSVQDMREVMFESNLGQLIVAKELAKTEVITLYDDDNLNTAMEKFSIKGLDELPVVGHSNERLVLGVVTRHDVMLAYKKAVLETSI